MAKKQLKSLLQNNFIVEISTQLPVSYYYMRHFKNIDYRFVLGSNLLKSTAFGLKRQWNIKLSQVLFIKPIILMGVGWWQYGNKFNLYTKVLYKNICHRDYLHSVRDKFTLEIMRDMGIKNVINTSCPTMWIFTSKFNSKIPNYKSNNVVFTITDYCKDELSDSKLIDLLHKEYKNVFFWPQGMGDSEYIDYIEKNRDKKVIKISPSLKEYDKLLENEDIDFIGTRLHGGIRALQKRCRTLILSIDNRAEEKKKDFNLPVAKRDDFDCIKNFIKKKYETNIIIPEKEIDTWKNQFNLV
jgi:polysaccharide pyruvyl transferase WcaK-like protein